MKANCDRQKVSLGFLPRQEEHFWAFVFFFFALTFLLMFVSAHAEDEQQPKGIIARAESGADYEKFEQPCHAPSSSATPAVRTSG